MLHLWEGSMCHRVTACTGKLETYPIAASMLFCGDAMPVLCRLASHVVLALIRTARHKPEPQQNR